MALLIVMIAVAMAGTLAMTFMVRQDATRGVGHNIAHHPRARAIATTGLDAAARYIKNNSDWHQDHTHGQWTSFSPYADGRFKLKFEDAAAAENQTEPNLANPSEGIRITAFAEQGQVSAQVSRVVEPAESSGNKLVLVVRNANWLDSSDRARKDMVENWGYDVTVLDDDASRSEYDQAASSASVFYISERVWSSGVSGKLRDQTIGVVSEEGYLNDELGLSNRDGPGEGEATIDIVEDDHYITQTLGTGEQTLTQYNQTMRHHLGSIADAADILARVPGEEDDDEDEDDDARGRGRGPQGLGRGWRRGHPIFGDDWVPPGLRGRDDDDDDDDEGDDDDRTVTLAAFDQGAATRHGAAAGRRVFLPWGDNAFDVDALTDSGQTILKRSLEWASGATSNQ
jgi:hypothetical protein